MVVCGGCGALDPDLALGQVVIVSAALRDEGTLFHDLPPSRTVSADPAVVAALERLLSCRRPLHYRYNLDDGRLLPGDVGKVARRREEGCITVEMEAAALIAVARFRQVRLGRRSTPGTASQATRGSIATGRAPTTCARRCSGVRRRRRRGGGVGPLTSAARRTSPSGPGAQLPGLTAEGWAGSSPSSGESTSAAGRSISAGWRAATAGETVTPRASVVSEPRAARRSVQPRRVRPERDPAAGPGRYREPEVVQAPAEHGEGADPDRHAEAPQHGRDGRFHRAEAARSQRDRRQHVADAVGDEEVDRVEM